MKSFCVSPLRATAIALAAIAVPGHGRAEAPARSVAEAPASIPAELSGLETLLGRVHPPDAESCPRRSEAGDRPASGDRRFRHLTHFRWRR